MKFFITGATGFLGAYVLQAALARGHECFCLARQVQGHDLLEHPRLQWLEGHLSDDWSCVFSEVDVLLHLAATGVSPQKATRKEYFQINVTDSLMMVDAAVSAGVKKVVVAGSCYEYGASGDRYDHIPVDAPLEPTNAYGASKAAASIALCALAREREFPLSLLRPFHFYGEGQCQSNLWPSLKAAALAGSDFEMTLGEQVRDYLPVEIVAKHFVDSAEGVHSSSKVPEILNVGSGEPISLRSFCEHWWAKWKAKGTLKLGAIPYREHEVMRFVPEI